MKSLSNTNLYQKGKEMTDNCPCDGQIFYSGILSTKDEETT